MTAEQIASVVFLIFLFRANKYTQIPFPCRLLNLDSVLFASLVSVICLNSKVILEERNMR